MELDVSCQHHKYSDFTLDDFSVFGLGLLLNYPIPNKASQGTAYKDSVLVLDHVGSLDAFSSSCIILFCCFIATAQSL